MQYYIECLQFDLIATTALDIPITGLNSHHKTKLLLKAINVVLTMRTIWWQMIVESRLRADICVKEVNENNINACFSTCLWKSTVAN